MNASAKAFKPFAYNRGNCAFSIREIRHISVAHLRGLAVTFAAASKIIRGGTTATHPEFATWHYWTLEAFSTAALRQNAIGGRVTSTNMRTDVRPRRDISSVVANSCSAFGRAWNRS